MNSSFLHTKTTGIPPPCFGWDMKAILLIKNHSLDPVSRPETSLEPLQLWTACLQPDQDRLEGANSKYPKPQMIRWLSSRKSPVNSWNLPSDEKNSFPFFFKVLVAVKKTLQFKHVKYPYKKNGIRAMMCHVFCRFQSFEDLTSESITSAPFPRCIERSSAS